MIALGDLRRRPHGRHRATRSSRPGRELDAGRRGPRAARPEGLADAAPAAAGTGAERQRRALEAARRAGRALVAGGGRLSTSCARALLSRFSGDPEPARRRGRRPRPAGRPRPTRGGATDALEAALVAGSPRRGVPVVGAERTDADPSLDRRSSTAGLATVDNIDQRPGQVALVLALRGADGRLRGQGDRRQPAAGPARPCAAPAQRRGRCSAVWSLSAALAALLAAARGSRDMRARRARARELPRPRASRSRPGRC